MVWLLFFYSVPAKLAKLRMRIWRRLLRLGAVSLMKGTAYILPFSEELRKELWQLTEEVRRLHGEAAFAKVDGIETVSDEEIKALFISARMEDYAVIEPQLATPRNRISPGTEASKAGCDRGDPEVLAEVGQALSHHI